MESRQIRVFISSTFRDMKAERDELVKYIFPKLRTLCESRGVSLNEVELRWGITDEEVAEGKALLICLDEIDRSRPFFLCMLGERYGWTPESIPENLLESYPWLSAMQGRSITELEIQYGALLKQEKDMHAYFYFRDSGFNQRLPEGSNLADYEAESAENAVKLQDLKQKIRESGFPLAENYQTPREFGELVLRDFTELMNHLYPENAIPTEFEIEDQEQIVYAGKLQDTYIRQIEYWNALNEHCEATDLPLFITGESGAGKSTLIANWTESYRQNHPDTLVISHHVDSTTRSASYQFMLKRILHLMNQKFQLSLEIPDQPKELRNSFLNALYQVNQIGKMVLLIDSIELLDNADPSLELIWLPTEIPPNVRIVVTTTPGKLVDKLRKRNFKQLRLRPFVEKECRELITQYLSKYRKQLTESQVSQILQSPKALNPNFLKSLLFEMRLYGDHDSLNEWLSHLLCAETVSSLYDKILSRYEKDYNRDRENLVQDTFTMLYCSRFGLTENELLEILGTEGQPLPTLFWSPLSIAASNFLVNQSGLLNLFQPSFQKALENRYMKSPETKKKVYQRLAAYWDKRDLSPRQCIELPWNLAQSQDYKKLSEVLSDMTFFTELYKTYREDVMKYWNLIETKSTFRKESVYEPIIKDNKAYPIKSLVYLADFFQITGLVDEAEKLFDCLKDRCEAESNIDCLMVILNEKASIVKNRGDFTEALEIYQKTEQFAQQQNNFGEYIRSINSQAFIQENLGKLSDAFELYKKAEQISLEKNNNKGLADAVNNQAIILEKWGRLQEAWNLHKESEMLSREIHDLVGVSTSLNHQARILKDWDKTNDALAIYKETEKIARELGDLFNLSQSLNNQAGALLKRDKLEEAWDLYKASEDIFRILDDKIQLSSVLVNQARLLEQWGRMEEAWDLYKETETVCRELQDPFKIAVCLNNEAYILKEWGRLNDALGLYKESEQVFRGLDFQKGIALSLTHQGTIQQELENTEEAYALFSSAMSIAQEKGYTQIEKMIQTHLDELGY